jgi:hypothetical protein
MKYSIVVAVNDDDILNKNMCSSYGVLSQRLILLKGYNNVCKAYNKGMMLANSEIVIFAHQDVFLPETFFPQLDIALVTIPDKNWGVLGVAGVNGLKDFKTVNDNNHEINYVGYILNQNKVWGSPDNLPSPVNTLDELLIIIKKNSFIFDEKIPNHHLFTTDLCLQAEEQGKKNYAILAFCHHNSKTNELPENYEESKNYIRNKWQHKLPIYTTCSIIK